MPRGSRGASNSPVRSLSVTSVRGVEPLARVSISCWTEQHDMCKCDLPRAGYPRKLHDPRQVTPAFITPKPPSHSPSAQHKPPATDYAKTLPLDWSAARSGLHQRCVDEEAVDGSRRCSLPLGGEPHDPISADKLHGRRGRGVGQPVAGQPAGRTEPQPHQPAAPGGPGLPAHSADAIQPAGVLAGLSALVRPPPPAHPLAHAPKLSLWATSARSGT